MTSFEGESPSAESVDVIDETNVDETSVDAEATVDQTNVDPGSEDADVAPAEVAAAAPRTRRAGRLDFPKVAPGDPHRESP